MLAPFFILAFRSPSRRGSVRRAVIAHLIVLLGLVLSIVNQSPGHGIGFVGPVLLTVGIIEGALLIGWRMTQLPRSQALEFLLVSPLRPTRLFLGEALVGITIHGLVTLSGLPVFLWLVGSGYLTRTDIVPLLIVPWTWGVITGLGLTVWAYEPKLLRKIGEVLMLLMVLLYLIIGILAGEKLREWLEFLPIEAKDTILSAFAAMELNNPFAILKHFLEQDRSLGMDRIILLEVISTGIIGLLLLRGSSRLQGHFHERHYEPVRDVTDDLRPEVGNRPLSWWAVKRVTEYSGKINLWLAGGFCLLYAAYMLAGNAWPIWMGTRMFQMCDASGGAVGIGAALIVLSAVPAAFQYGLWDSSVQDRCRRLELLLLTNLQPRDYWEAAATAAWVRGRGYFVIAVGLWLAAFISGRITFGGMMGVAATGILLWTLYFALGFRAFARGVHAGGLGMLLTVGLPLGAYALSRMGFATIGGWLPPGMVYQAGTGPASFGWLVGPFCVAVLTLLVSRQALSECDARLRQWYDENHGNKLVN